jgi:hypothetical protein
MKKRRGDGQPHLDHEILDQAAQARWLGSKVERVKNLGHNSTVDRLTENPVGHPIEYDPKGVADRVINEKRQTGVYEKFRDPQSGLSEQRNLDRWADYAKSNSYTGHRAKAGHGKYPTMPDPRGSHSNKSDGYLESTRRWPDFDRAGSESGEGRLDKLHKHNKR